MGSELEIRKEQKRLLVLLNSLENGEVTLAQAKRNLMAEMVAEDVAYVEKLLKQS